MIVSARVIGDLQKSDVWGCSALLQYSISASESASDVSESVSAPLKSKHARSVITSYNTAWYVI